MDRTLESVVLSTAKDDITRQPPREFVATPNMSAHGYGFQRFDLPDGAEIKLQPLQQRALEPPRSTLATKTLACVSTSRVPATAANSYPEVSRIQR